MQVTTAPSFPSKYSTLLPQLYRHHKAKHNTLIT